MSVTSPGFTPILDSTRSGRTNPRTLNRPNQSSRKKTGVEEDESVATSDQPDGHRDVDGLVLRCIWYEATEREVRDLAVTDREDLGFLSNAGYRGDNERQQEQDDTRWKPQFRIPVAQLPIPVRSGSATRDDGSIAPLSDSGRPWERGVHEIR